MRCVFGNPFRSPRLDVAAAGLILARHTATATLAEYVDRYRTHRGDVSKGTSTNYKATDGEAAQKAAQPGRPQARRDSSSIGSQSVDGESGHKLATCGDDRRKYLMTPTGFEPVSRP